MNEDIVDSLAPDVRLMPWLLGDATSTSFNIATRMQQPLPTSLPTKADWEGTRPILAMQRLLAAHLGRRLLRLFTCALIRQVQPKMREAAWVALRTAEDYADGIADYMLLNWQSSALEGTSREFAFAEEMGQVALPLGTHESWVRAACNPEPHIGAAEVAEQVAREELLRIIFVQHDQWLVTIHSPSHGTPYTHYTRGATNAELCKLCFATWPGKLRARDWEWSVSDRPTYFRREADARRVAALLSGAATVEVG